MNRGILEEFITRGSGFILEVDFFVKWPDGKKTLLQVAWDLDDARTRERELKGFEDALKTVKGVDELMIATHHTRDSVRAGRRHLKIIPAYEWMCNS